MTTKNTGKMAVTKVESNDVEGAIHLSDVVSEIELMLKDYYVAELSKAENNILIRFSNGQKFKLIVEENK